MSQWSEKIPKENLPETVSSTRYFFGSFKIQINNFRKSFKKFIVDLLTRNVALNLSGAIFFVGLGYSLKWWYKDQLFVILVKQNLPALSESQQNVSWETGEAILNGDYQTWTPRIDRIDLYANHVRVKFKQPWQKHVYERFLGVFGESAQINVCKQMLTTKDWWKENNSVGNNCSPGELKKNTPLPYNANPTSSELSVPFQGKSSFGTLPLDTKFSFANGVSEAEVSFANRTPFYLSPLNIENSEEIKSKKRNNFSGGVYNSKKLINYVNKFSTYTPEKPIFPKRWFKLSPRNLCFLDLDDTLHSSQSKKLRDTLAKQRGPLASQGMQSHLSNSNVKQSRGIHTETAIKFSYPLQLTKKLTGWQPSPNLFVLNSYRDEIPYKLENTFQSYFPKKDSQLLFLSTSFRKAIILPTTSFFLTKSIRPITSIQSFSFRPKGICQGKPSQCKATVSDSIRVKALTLYLPDVQISEDGKANRGLTSYETLHSFLLYPEGFAKLSFVNIGDLLRPSTNISSEGVASQGQDVSKASEEGFELARNETKKRSFTLTESKTGSIPTTSKKQTSLIINPCLSNINNAFDNNYTPQFLLKPRKELRPINGVNTSPNDNRPFPLASLTSCPKEMLFLPSERTQSKKKNQSEEIRAINCKNSQFLDLSTKLIAWETQLCQYILKDEMSKKENNEAKQLDSKDLFKEATDKISFNKFLLPTKQTETYLKKSHLLETKKLLRNQLALLCKAFPINFVEKSGDIVKDSFASTFPLQSKGHPRGVEADVKEGKLCKPLSPNKEKGLGVRQSIDFVDNKSNVFATSEIGNENNIFETNDHHLVNVTKKILTVKPNQQKGPKGALLIANSTIANDAHAVKREGLDPLLLLNTLGFTFNNFSPLTNPPILLANTKLVTPFASLGLANLVKSGVNINSITPHQKSFANIFDVVPSLTSASLTSLPSFGKDAKQMLTKEEMLAKQEGKLRVPPVLCVQRKGLRIRGVTESNLKKCKPLFNFLSQRLSIADVVDIPSEAKGTKSAKDLRSRGCEQEKYVSFYFNPKNQNWVIFQQSTNCKFNSLLKKIAGKTNQLVTTESTHLMFEFLKEKKGLSSLPSFASPVVTSSMLTRQHKTKRAFTPPESEAAIFTGPITSNEPITIALPSDTLKGSAKLKETESTINADALVPQNIPSEANELEAESLYKSYQAETGVLQSCLPCAKQISSLRSKVNICFAQDVSEAEINEGIHLLSSAHQKLALLRGLRSFNIENVTPSKAKGLEVDRFTTISNINKISLKLKETKLETLNNINVVDTGINFDKNSRYMSGYVYPDIQSNFLKAQLDQWFTKNNNFFKFNSFAPTRFQRNEMVGILDKACLSDIEILSKKIKPTTFASLHTPSALLTSFPSFVNIEDVSKAKNAKQMFVLTPSGYSKKEVQDEVLHSFPSKSKDNFFDVSKASTSVSLGNSVQPRAFTPTDCFYPFGVSEGLAEQTVRSSALLKNSLLMPSSPSEAKSAVKEAKINLLPIKNIGHIEVPYKKFNHYLAKFPGFSDPSQFFTTLPEISCGNENLVNKSQGFAFPCEAKGTKSSKQISSLQSKRHSRGVEADVSACAKQISDVKEKMPSEAKASTMQSDQLGINYVDLSYPEGVQKSIDKSEITKLFIQKNGCNFRKVAYSGIVVQRNKWTKDFQPFNDSKKVLDGASESSIWGTLFLGPENPLTNRQCHFFGQKQLSTLDTNSLQRDYLRQLGKEILTQSNSKGYTELSKFSSIERTKILSLSKKVNSFFFKKRKYSYLLEPKDQWHLLFQEQLCTALEDGKKYPSSTSRSFEETNTASLTSSMLTKEEKLSNFRDSFGSGRIKVSAPLVMSRFPKKLVQSDRVCFGKPPQPGKSVPSSNAKGSVLRSQGFELARNDNYLLQQVSSKPRAIHTDSFASLGMFQLPSYRLEQGISWRPFCHLQRSYLLNDALLTSFPCLPSLTSAPRPKEEMAAKQMLTKESKVSTFNPFLAKQRVRSQQSTEVKINPRFNEFNQNKLSELGEGFANSITSNETSELGYRQLEKTNGVFANPLEVVISMSPYFSYLPSASFPSFLLYPEGVSTNSCFYPSGVSFPSFGQEGRDLLRTRSQELRGNESSQSLKLISHYPLFTERFTEEINTVPYLNKNSLFYLPTSFLSLTSSSTPSEAKGCPLLCVQRREKMLPKQSVGVKAPSKLILTDGLGVHKSIDSVSFADPISKAELRVQRKGTFASHKKAKPSMNSLLGIQNMCTSLLIQEPSVSSCSALPWAILNQWIFLIALLFWIEQTLLDNVFPALFALEQILLSAAGLKTGGNNRSDGLRISKNETPKFHNLAGIDGLLGELSELVLFLRSQRNLGVAKLNLWNNTDSFTSLGMPLNKKNSYGVLLTGSPGTGKTFLVRALANEANVPVLILSASTLTTSKLNNNKPSWSIRHAFKRAKQLAPCILFIDEIDALGKSRGKIVTDINEIVADTNLTSASSLGHKRMFTSLSHLKESFTNPVGRAQLMFSYEQFGQNYSNFTAPLLNKWEYPLQSTILQESNEINQNSLCQEKLVDLLKIASPGLGKLAGIRSTKLNDVQDFSRKGSELIDSSRSKKESTTDFSDDLSYPKGLTQQQLPTREKELTRGKFGPLTQLLVSMDGVSSVSGVLIMGATNRPELLDPALTRPGRFEKIIRIDKPSEQNRIEILQLYSQNLGVQQQIPWSYLATRTIGLTTADLAVAMNYSSLRAIIQGSVHTLETIEYGLNCITRL